MTNGLMMHCNLNITSIMQHALIVYADQEIVTLKADGISKHRYRLCVQYEVGSIESSVQYLSCVNNTCIQDTYDQELFIIIFR
ncbi:hypothetical protein ACKER7_13425 [Acinetobacter baumannii]|uniref:hypothetical protein n=1 Tax=Acinetobacter baumannii TaxID=470 RepID=UPI0038B62B7C